MNPSSLEEQTNDTKEDSVEAVSPARVNEEEPQEYDGVIDSDDELIPSDAVEAILGDDEDSETETAGANRSDLSDAKDEEFDEEKDDDDVEDKEEKQDDRDKEEKQDDDGDKQMKKVDEDGEEYVVEKILDKRIRKGVWQYLVKWADLPEEESSWEPSTNLTNCTALLADFEKEWLKKKLQKKGGPGRGYTKSILGGRTRAKNQDSSDSEAEDDEPSAKKPREELND